MDKPPKQNKQRQTKKEARDKEERPLIEAFAARIKNLMDEDGLTVKDLAEAVDLSSGILSDYRKGFTSPTAPKLRKIADYFGVSTDYLLGRTDDRKLQTLATGSSLGLSADAAVRIETFKDRQSSPSGHDVIGYINYVLTDDALAQLSKSFWYYLNLSNPDVLRDMTEYLDNAPQETASRLRENFLRLAREDALNAYAKFIDRAAKEHRDRP